jgi:hypothetical protein
MSRRIVDVVLYTFVRTFVPSMEHNEYKYHVDKIIEIRESDTSIPSDVFQYYSVYGSHTRINKKYIMMTSDEFDVSPIFFRNGQKLEKGYFSSTGLHIGKNQFDTIYKKNGIHVLTVEGEDFEVD